MGTLTHKVCRMAFVLILAVLLSAPVGLRGRVEAQDSSGVGWSTQSEINDDTTDTNQDISDTSQQQSTDGQDITDLQTNQADLQDGSFHDHEEIDGSDPAARNGYERWSQDRDTDQDAKGNRTEHYEEITEKDGECQKLTIDDTYDSQGNHTKHTESTTPVPCMSYSMQVSVDGSANVEDTVVTYGPDTATIPLELNNGTYTGSYSGQFHDSTKSSDCTGSGVFPVSFDVTAKKDEFNDMEITMNNAIGAAITVACDGSSASKNIPITKYTKTFTLPAEDGASKKDTTPDGAVTWTYTLKSGNTRAH